MDDPRPHEAARERREVRSQDPSLSPEANRILTEELRQAVGRDAVEVPAARAHAEREPHGGHGALAVVWNEHRLPAAMGLLSVLVFGAILALTTGSWWFLALAVALDLLSLVAVAGFALRMTTHTEHASPSATARLQEEGVEDPDALLSDLVEEYAPDGRRGGGERATSPRDDPAQATSEQRSAVTPTHDPSRPTGS